MLCVEFWVLYAISIVAEIVGTLSRIFVIGCVALERFQQRFQMPLIEFVITPLNPFLTSFAVTVDHFPDGA